MIAAPAPAMPAPTTPSGALHPDACLFGSGAGEVTASLRRRGIRGVVHAAAHGVLRALVIDARSPLDFVRAQELLRTLYDDPRAPAPVLAPGRVVALVSDGDVEAAFAIGRYGIAGVLEERRLGELEAWLVRLARSSARPQPMSVPVLAPPRSTLLAPRGEGQLPTVAIGHRHAPETLETLALYQRVLRAAAHESTVFADVATAIDVLVSEGLTCQTSLAAKAGATHDGQFIGSFAFYRELRRTRYARIPDPPGTPAEIAMEVLIAVDEILHEVLHLLFLANQLRAGLPIESTLFAEELSLTWWQAVVHNRVFPDWLRDRHILEINDDFLLSETNVESRGFWTRGTVFERYAGYPWVPYVVSRLPERASYIGERADLEALVATYRTRPEAAFLVSGPRDRLTITVPFDAYPRVPETLRVGP